MMRPLLLSLSALLVSAGGALSASSFLGEVEAGQRITMVLEDGAVETLVVRNTTSKPSKHTLLIGLHGFGMDASQIATLVHVDPAFEHLYLAPEGFHQLDDGSRAWFPIEPDGQGGIAFEPEALQTFMERFERYVDAAVQLFKPERVVLIGYSQGGAAAITLALERPQLADAFVGLAGSVLPGLPSRGRATSRLFIGHGTLDAFVPTAEMRSQVQRLHGAGLDLTYKEYDIPHVVSAAQRRDVTAWLEASLGL